MWSAVNSAVSAVVDAWLWPLGALPALWQAVALGLPAGLLALLAFRTLSDQEAIARAKDRVQAHLLELALFPDQPGVFLRAQLGVLVWNAAYLRRALLPVAVLAVPFALLVTQVETRFAYRGLAPGESAILTARLDPGLRPTRVVASLEPEGGVLVDSPALRIDGRREIAWRIRALAVGEHELRLRVGAAQLSGRARVGADAPAWPTVYRRDRIHTLLAPGQRPLPPASPVLALELTYPARGRSFAGLSGATWAFVVASLATAAALRGPLRVAL